VDYKETMSDGLQAGILLEMMPSAVTEVMTQRIKEEDDYSTVKDCLLRYIETKEDFGGVTPMDVDRLEIEEGHDHEHGGEVNAMGKGGAKGGYNAKGGGQFPGVCNRCGEWGTRRCSAP